MKKQIIATLAALPLVLSACSKSEDGGSAISIDLSDESAEDSEKIKIGGGEDSKFSIKADGFSMDVDLPEITLDSDDFDLNNVALYPGSKVTRFNIEDEKGNGGKVTVGFVSPAGVDELTDWFESKMTEEKFEVTKDGNNLSGSTDEGDPFSLSLTEKSADETTGTLKFAEK